MTTTLVLYAVRLGFTCLISTAVAFPQFSPNDGDQIAYVFDCAGRYVRVDLNAGTLSEPKEVPGAATGIGGFDGCLVKAVASEPRPSVIYAVMSKQRRTDSSGRSQDKVVALQVPDLAVLSSVDIPFFSDRVPKIRYNRSAQELSITYRTPGDSAKSASGVQYVLSTAARDRLAFRTAAGTSDTARSVAGPNLLGVSSNSYVAASGRVVEGDRIADANGAVSTIDGGGLLTGSVKQKLQSLQRLGATGNPYVDVLFADSAAGRMLFLAAWDSNDNRSVAGGGLLVYDAVKGEVLSSILTPYREAAYELLPGTPTVHLSPDGETIVVEDYRWTPPAIAGRSIQERLKTGAIALYDAATGSQRRVAQLNPAPGISGRLIGFSPDSALLYYASDQCMYVLDLSGGRSLTLNLPQGFAPARVVTADR